MKSNYDDYVARVKIRRPRTGESSQGKINALLADLLEKEEELSVYRNRLKELEGAFYYNLDLISERDFELSVLEKQVAAGHEELEVVIRERNELEDLVRAMDEKSRRKIEELETRLSLKEEEIMDLRRVNLGNIRTLKRIIDDVKAQEEKKISKISTKYEAQKNELMKGHREEMEEKEKYYLMEIDKLTGKLEHACREKERLGYAEEEARELKRELEEMERVFLGKERKYLEEMKNMSKSRSRKVNREVQCAQNAQQSEKVVQAKPDIAVADSQTSPVEEQQQERIAFLQEQNEVLKFIIKDLKRNREGDGQQPGCECLTLREDVEMLKKELGSEMSNLREIVERELRGRAEEEAVIGSLETSVRCLKEKLLSGLEEEVEQKSGNDLCAHTCNGEAQVALLDWKLSQKIDSLMTATREERQQVHQKLEELKKETIARMDRYLESSQKPEGTRSDDLLQKVRLEMQNLENKIESDVKNLLGNDCESEKCYKTVAGPRKSRNAAGGCNRNELSPEDECRSQVSGKLRNNLLVGR